MQCEEGWLVMHALFAHHGWSICKIARDFGVDWRTARRYATAEAVPRYRSRQRLAELTEAQLAYLERRLRCCHDLRATTLYRELAELGYRGSYPSLVRRIRTIRPRDEETDPTVRFETEPGVQVQWTGPTAGAG
jgi:transposase